MKYNNYEENKEYFANYQKTSIKAKEARKRYYDKNKEKWKDYATKYRSTDKGKIKWLYNGLKGRAKAKGLEFDLTIEDIIIPDVCPVLGIPIKQDTYANRENSPSIDRFDNNRGYTKDNIRIISYRANRLKSDSTIEEMEKLIVYMKEVIV